MSVTRACRRDVVTIGPADTVQHACSLMASRNVGSLIAVDDGGAPVGILTDRDVVIRCVVPGKNLGDTPVSEVMTGEPKRVTEAAPVEAALSTMQFGGFRRLPVVSEEGKLVGLITFDDVLGLIADEFTQISQLILKATPKRELSV